MLELYIESFLNLCPALESKEAEIHQIVLHYSRSYCNTSLTVKQWLPFWCKYRLTDRSLTRKGGLFLLTSLFCQDHPRCQLSLHSKPIGLIKFDDHLNKINGRRWWKSRWGMVRMAWVPKKRELASIGVSPPHFLQHNGANIPPRAHPPCVRTIKSKGWSIFKVGAFPWYWWDIKWGLWYRGMSGASLILGDIGVARTGYRGRSCLWYPPLVSTVVSTPPTGGRKQGAKAHFSLSRFGDYPISLTLTSLTSPAELDTIPF